MYVLNQQKTDSFNKHQLTCNENIPDLWSEAVRV